MGRYYYGFPEYVPVAQKRAKAARKLKQLRKKNPEIRPVLIEGNSISRTWWGKSWNRNLERYADYSNRIGRGRSYVRHGAVLDLQVKPGKIRALVQGSAARPYEVEISIKALGKNSWKRIREAAEGQLDSLAALLAGKFPKPLQALFFARDQGLFPSPREIHFNCSCPDWASMCKHVAATLYGVGARLDEDPRLFFALRRIEMEELIGQALKSTTRTLLKKAKKKSSRVMEDADLSDIFGIELEGGADPGPEPAKRRSRPRARISKVCASAKKPKLKKAAKKKSGAARRAKAESGPQRTPGKSAPPKKASGKAAARRARTFAQSPGRRNAPAGKTASPADGGFVDRVVAALARRRKGMRIAELCARVDLSERQVRNAVARAVAQGKLRRCDRGVYARP